MPDSLDMGGPRLLSGLSPREWSLRRKVALAVLIPIALAAVFGGLRVRNDLAQADNYSSSASRVSVLEPATDYLAAVENAAVVSLRSGDNAQALLEEAVAAVDAAAVAFEESLDDARLTATQRERAESMLSLTEDARTPQLYAVADQSVAVLRQIQISVNQLIAAIVEDQIEPDARLQVLDQVLGGRISLAIQQFAVADDKDGVVKPYDVAAEIGVESAAIERVAAVVGGGDSDISALRRQNALHLTSIRGGGSDLGDETAYAPYDSLTAAMFDDIDRSLAAAADDSQRDALVNSIITLAALLAAIVLALLVSRLLLDPIRRVRDGALEVAHERLPQAVRTIRAGGDPGEIVPIDVTTHEEMGQLARAVDGLHQEAVNLAAGEAKLRSQVGEMFVTLSRRSTSLINQQLGLIEKLEKDEEDPKRLESLFRLDHLASRMRRTADSLNVLADAPAGPTDPHGLSISDVLQAAISGVQEYQRVQIDADATERVAGFAAADTVHLVTELIDNALAYSPPSSNVVVATSSSPEGVVITVSDAGLGMKDDAMLSLNHDLRSGGEVNAETARRMGLLVVSRIAKRHGIRVELERNTRGGVTASVVLPIAILRTVGESPQSAQPVVAPEPPPSLEVVEEPALEEVVEEPPAEQPVAEEPAVAEPAAPVLPVRPTPAPALPMRQRASDPPAPAGGLAARLQAMREAREAASLGNPGTPAPAVAPGPPARPAVPGSTEAIEAAINAVIRLPQRRPGAAEVPGALTPLFPTPAEAEEAPAAVEPEIVEPEPVEPERVAVEPQVAEAPAPAVEPEPQRDAEPEPAPEPAPEQVVAPVVAAVSPIPTATTSFSVLDADSPMPEPLSEDGSIFASMRSNWFNADGADQPWNGNEVDSGWEAADRVAEATPLQVSESGLPVRRPGARIVPGGVGPAPAALVRDPEAIRARLAAHAAGVNRGRLLAGGAQAAEAMAVETDHSDHSQEADPT
jgi:signal transduction histidine kinase